MATYIVRPYFAFDCDSTMGFNNGQYLREIRVEADDRYQAAAKARAEYLHESGINGRAMIDAANSFGLECGLYQEFDHVWRTPAGEEFTSEPDDVEAQCDYLYKYIDFAQDITEE